MSVCFNGVIDDGEEHFHPYLYPLPVSEIASKASNKNEMTQRDDSSKETVDARTKESNEDECVKRETKISDKASLENQVQ